MSRIKMYALTVPSDEVYMHWVGSQKMERVMDEIDVAAVNPDGNMHHLLFKTQEARTYAYNRIHEALPQSFCAYQALAAYVDEKYLKQS